MTRPCLGDISIERLWRLLKFECIYLHAREAGSRPEASFGHWITF